jgi:hypothetical protein
VARCGASDGFAVLAGLARWSCTAGVATSGVCHRRRGAADDDPGQTACGKELVHHDRIPFRCASVAHLYLEHVAERPRVRASRQPVNSLGARCQEQPDPDAATSFAASAVTRGSTSRAVGDRRVMAAVVTALSTRCEFAELTGDGLRRFRLVRPVRESLQDNQVQPLYDWASSSRRFKSCQPDRCQPDRHQCRS